MYINGRNAVTEALRAEDGKSVEKVFIMFGTEGEAVSAIRALAKRAGVPCVIADRKRFAELERRAGTETRSQGVIAFVSDVEYTSVESVVDAVFVQGGTPLVVALDGVTDPHNVGAIIRSAECAGLHGLMLEQRESASITDVVVKTSAGAAAHLPIERVKNLGDVLVSLQQTGVQIVGLDERSNTLYTAHDFTVPTAIVIGSEGEGLSSKVRKICNTLVRIPMQGKVESLNASVAAGVVFFEAVRQRGKDEG